MVISAENGCPVCRPIFDSYWGFERKSLRDLESNDIGNTNGDALHPEFITSAQLIFDTIPESIVFLVQFHRELFPELSHRAGMFMLQKDNGMFLLHKTSAYADQAAGESECDVYAEGDVTADHTSSNASFELASMWLRDCVQSHPRCNSHKDGTSWYPTRLLHLVESDGKEGYVRLIRTAETSLNEHYATLSHRWGNTRPLQLTKSAASDPNHRFLVAEMPRTFQEAIQVSRRLGIQYLWIDSLCIIQEGDNLRDWYYEAGLMDKVYMHSYLNIAAADADDGTKGLFRHHPPLPLGCQRVAVNTKEFGSGTGCTDYLMTDLMLWLHNLDKSPLHNRGWVFQERFLAPRNLHFFRDQLFFECNERTVCETFPKGLPSVITKLTTASIKSRLWKQEDLSVLPDRYGEDLRNLWYSDVVSQYSPMDLSVSTDKLIALSGIAKFFMARLEDTYVAGMWHSQLEDSLLWSVSPSGLLPRPLVYRSPTWSWASVDGRIRPNLDWEDRELLIHVEDVVLSHATEDTTGAVTGGWLDLRGVLKPVRLSKPERLQTVLCMAFDSEAISQQAETTEDDSSSTIYFLPDTMQDTNWVEDNAQKRLFFTPCIKEDTSGWAHGLVLRLVDKEMTLFERIGLISTDTPAEKEMMLADLSEDTKARLPCLRYENGLHTIRII